MVAPGTGFLPSPVGTIRSRVASFLCQRRDEWHEWSAERLTGTHDGNPKMTSDPYRYGQPPQPRFEPSAAASHDSYASDAYSAGSAHGHAQPHGVPYQPWSAAAAPAVRYASLWSRLGALLIDCVLYLAVYLLVTTLTGGFSTDDGEVAFGATGLTAVLLWLAGPLYWVGLEAKTGATLGKRALHLRVVSAEGGPIGLRRAVVRYLLLIVDTFAFGLVGMITARASDQRQRVGDRVAGTVVIRAD